MFHWWNAHVIRCSSICFNVHPSSIIIINQFSCSSIITIIIIIIKQHLAVRSNTFFKSPVSSNQDISDHARYENHSTSLEMVVIRVTIPKWPYFSFEYLQIIQIHHLLVISCYCSTRNQPPHGDPPKNEVFFFGRIWTSTRRIHRWSMTLLPTWMWKINNDVEN